MTGSTQYTRCPYCHTIFRIHDKQLAVAQGKVRCGACFSVFNGVKMQINEPLPESQLPEKTGEAYDNAEELDPDTLLVDNVVIKQEHSTQKNNSAFSRLERDIHALVSHADHEAGTEDFESRDVLQEVSDGLDAIDEQLQQFEETIKSNDNNNHFESASSADSEATQTSPEYDHPSIGDTPSLEEILEDFSDDDISDDLDEELDHLLSSEETLNTAEPIPEEEKMPLPDTKDESGSTTHTSHLPTEHLPTDNPEKDALLHPNTGDGSKVQATTHEEHDESHENSRSETQQQSKAPLQVASIPEDIDYEGYDDDNLFTRSSDTPPDDPLFDPITQTDSLANDAETTAEMGSFNDDLVDDLDAFTKNLQEEVEGDTAEASRHTPKTTARALKAEQSKSALASSTNTSHKEPGKAKTQYDEELIDDLDTFTQQLADEIAATVNSAKGSTTEPDTTRGNTQPSKLPGAASSTAPSATPATASDTTQSTTPSATPATAPSTTTVASHKHPTDSDELPPIGELATPAQTQSKQTHSRSPKVTIKPHHANASDVALNAIRSSKGNRPASRQAGPALSAQNHQEKESSLQTPVDPAIRRSPLSSRLRARIKASGAGRKKIPLPVWVIGSLILSLSLYSQILWVKKDTFAQQPTMRSQLVAMCSVFGCSVPPRKDIRKIKLVERRVLPNKKRRNVLDVRLVIANTANFEQPLPDIELIFSDQIGKNVASRRFTPEEYKRSNIEITTIPANIELNVKFSVKQPDKKVTGYQFVFH